MKSKKTLLSAFLAASMLFTSACSQTNNNVELNSESSSSTVSVNETAVPDEVTDSITTAAKTDVSGLASNDVSNTYFSSETGNIQSEASTDKKATAANTEKPKVTTQKPAAVTPKPVIPKPVVTASAKPAPTPVITTKPVPAPVITTKPTPAPVVTTTTTKPAPPPVVTTTTTKPEPAPSVSSGFKVSGTKLLDANGNEFIMRGINHAHVWYRSNLDQALQGIANTGANCVRIVLGDGNSTNGWGPTSESEIKSIIQKCKDKKLICILESHNATGSNNASDLDKAVEYWKNVKNAFIGEEKYVIINIANEWYGSWDNLNKWKDGYVNAVKKLRSAGIKNTLMVDAAGWGQCAKSIPQHAEQILNADSDKNTMFSIHMYGSAGGNKSQIKTNIDNVLNKNLCLVIGEFGWNHSDGDVDEDYIMQYCTEKKVGYIAWSWKGNGGGVEYLDISKDWSGNSLSDWGKNLVNNAYGIKKTAKKCTVF